MAHPCVPQSRSAAAGPATLLGVVAFIAAAAVVPTGLTARQGDRCYYRGDLRCLLWNIGGRTDDGRFQIHRGEVSSLADPAELLDAPPSLGLSELPQVASERVLLDPPKPPLTVVHLVVWRGCGPIATVDRAAVLQRLLRCSDLTTVFVDVRSDEAPGGLMRQPAWVTARPGRAFAEQLRSHEGVVVALFADDRDVAAELAGTGVRLIRVEVRNDGCAS